MDLALKYLHLYSDLGRMEALIEDLALTFDLYVGFVNFNYDFTTYSIRKGNFQQKSVNHLNNKIPKKLSSCA